MGDRITSLPRRKLVSSDENSIGYTVKVGNVVGINFYSASRNARYMENGARKI